MSKKIWVLLALAAGLAAFFYFDLGQHLSFAALQSNRDRLLDYRREHPLAMTAGFILVYTAAAALSLPGAAVLSLAGGAIFGPALGTLAVILGATGGATLAFLASRFLLRGWVEKKFGSRLRPLNEGFAGNAVNYILFLRLMPVFPFFLVNLAAGLTTVSLRVYFFGTMFGIIPGTFVFVNAGSNLAAVSAPGDILSPGVLGALALLGAFALAPVIYRRFAGRGAQPRCH